MIDSKKDSADGKPPIVIIAKVTVYVGEVMECNEAIHFFEKICVDIFGRVCSPLIVVDNSMRVAWWNGVADGILNFGDGGKEYRYLKDVCHWLAKLLVDGIRVTCNDDEFVLARQYVVVFGETRCVDISVFPFKQRGESAICGRVVRIDEVTPMSLSHESNAE